MAVYPQTSGPYDPETDEEPTYKHPPGTSFEDSNAERPNAQPLDNRQLQDLEDNGSQNQSNSGSEESDEKTSSSSSGEQTEGEPGGGLYNDKESDDSKSSGRGGRLRKARSAASNNKLFVGLGVGGLGAIAAIIIVLVIIAGAYKIVDFAENVAAWQFARVTGQMAEDTANITREKIGLDSIADDASGNAVRDAIKSAAQAAQGQATAVLDKIDSYNPNKIISNFQDEGNLKFNYERTGILKRNVLKSVTINGEDVGITSSTTDISNSFASNNIPGFKLARDVSFSRDFTPDLISAMKANEIGPITRARVASQIRSDLDVGLLGWITGKFAGESEAKANAEIEREAAAVGQGEQLSFFDDGTLSSSDVPKVAQGSDSGVNNAAQDTLNVEDQDLASAGGAAAAAANPNSTPTVVENELTEDASDSAVSGLQNSLLGSALSIANPIYKYAVPLCLIYDGSLQQSGPTMNYDTEQAEREGIWTQAAAGQEKDGGDVTGEAVGAVDWKLGDISKSIAEERASGIQTNTSVYASTEASPTGQYTYSVADFLPGGLGSVVDSLSPGICSTLTNVYVGIGGGLVALGLTALTGGLDGGLDAGAEAGLDAQMTLFSPAEFDAGADAEAGSSSFLTRMIGKAQNSNGFAKLSDAKDTVKGFAKSTAKSVVAIGALTLVARSLVASEMGGNSSTLATGSSFDDSQADLGTNAYAGQIEQQEYMGAPMTDADLGSDYSANESQLSEENSQGSAYQRYASLSNPNSLISRFAITSSGFLNKSLFSTMLADLGQFLSDPLKSVGTLFSPIFGKANAAAAVTSDNTYYGNVQFGFTSQEKNLMDNDPSYGVVENQEILDKSGVENQISSTYGKCFTETAATMLSNGDLKRSADGDVLDDSSLCSPNSLGPDNMGGLVFRWRVAEGYNNTLDQLSQETDVTQNTTVSTNSCATSQGSGATGYQSSFNVIGKNICDNNGNSFTPYGVSVIDDLDESDWCTQHNEEASLAQIQAASQYWHVNSVRLQVSENNFINGSTCVYGGKTYTAQDAMQELGTEVNAIEQAGDVPIINDNNELTGGAQAPTQNTITFWNLVTAYLGAQNTSGVYDNIIFDIFNEPITEDKVWQSGGTYQGNSYIGMQDIVNSIRQGTNLNNNVIMVEGDATATGSHAASLAVLANYQISGTNIAYAFHHINLNLPQSSWGEEMGLDSGVTAPIVDGEWAQYDAARPFECYTSAPSNTAAYLSFLQQNNIGLIFFSLEPGVGTVSESTPHPVSDSIAAWMPTEAAGYSQPDTFSGGAYNCTTSLNGNKNSTSDSGDLLGIGAGYDVQQYFQKYSGK
jgi:hypothetical protein